LNSEYLSRLAAVSRIESDSTGVETFARYLWQAKQVVRLWLSSLTENQDLLYAVCEHVEDLTLVCVEKIRFLQLKTRDRGSWSAAKMCDNGLDALVRSYKAARDASVHEEATFELWLEGPISDAKETVSFVDKPTTANQPTRRKIVNLGLPNTWLNDFLERLIILPDQPPRAHVDAKALYELGSIWPGASQSELRTLYERLLNAATAAQAADSSPTSICAILATAAAYPLERTEIFDQLDESLVGEIRNQILTRELLIELTPPQPGESASNLLKRLSNGSSLSMLELKMRTNGAALTTIERTKKLRADMEVKRQLLLASRARASLDLADLADRVLVLAHATAGTVAMSSAVNPVAASRSAEAIALNLMSRPADLAQCDSQAIFDKDGYTIFGFLAHLSDECRFPWRAE
jgi:hypothetical protein